MDVGSLRSRVLLGTRVYAGPVLACLVCASGLAACASSTDSTAHSTIPAYTAAPPSTPPADIDTGPPGPADGSGAPASTASTDSLSSPSDNYTVTSVPGGLTPEQEQVLIAYASYDQRAWRSYRSLSQDDAASVGEYASGQALISFDTIFADRAAQQVRVQGSGAVSFASVEMTGDSQAVVTVCVDTTGASLVDATGAPAGEDIQHRYSSQATLHRNGQTWTVVSDETTGVDDC